MYPQAGLELLAFLLLVRDSKYIPPHWAFLRTVLFYLIPPPPRHAVFLYMALVVLEIPT